MLYIRLVCNDYTKEHQHEAPIKSNFNCFFFVPIVPY
jgi:hypothetical protein